LEFTDATVPIKATLDELCVATLKLLDKLCNWLVNCSVSPERAASMAAAVIPVAAACEDVPGVPARFATPLHPASNPSKPARTTPDTKRIKDSFLILSPPSAVKKYFKGRAKLCPFLSPFSFLKFKIVIPKQLFHG
jgi:hypothetical protein